MAGVKQDNIERVDSLWQEWSKIISKDKKVCGRSEAR